MERIKHALEKARQGKPPSQPSYLRGTVELSSTRVAEFCYSNTQVVSLDPRQMEANRIVGFNKSDAASTKFDLLRTQVLRKMEQNGWRSLAIVSPSARAGKTVVAVNLAMSIAQHTEKTAILVDFDLRKPSVAHTLGLNPDKSLNDVFGGEVKLSDAMINPGIPRLVILPTMRPEQNPAELLASSRIVEMISELRERYKDRVVLFDLPPLLAVDDAMSVLPRMDCALVVVGNGESTKAEIQETIRHLGCTGVLGVVLNKAGDQKNQYS